MKRKRTFPAPIFRAAAGFTLFELFMAILILAVAVVPMMNAFAPALLSTGQAEEQVLLTGKARSTLNRLNDLSFGTLEANQGSPVNLTALFGSATEAAKENLAYKGQTLAPVVTIADVSGGAGGLLELTITLKSITLRTLKSPAQRSDQSDQRGCRIGYGFWFALF